MKAIYSFVTISKNIFLSLAFLANERNDKEIEDLNIPAELKLDDFFLTNPKNS